jgi:hypothetical protein
MQVNEALLHISTFLIGQTTCVVEQPCLNYTVLLAFLAYFTTLFRSHAVFSPTHTLKWKIAA